MDWQQQVDRYVRDGTLTPRLATILNNFKRNYTRATVASGYDPQKVQATLQTFLELTTAQIKQPHSFECIHHKIREPFDYYAFGLDFLRPLVDFPRSRVEGWSNVERIETQLKLGDSVVLLANHQIEPDPQVISLLLEERCPKLGEEMFFVAGDRVTTDPLAAPFSMGRNLVCIYSKKHIDHPPEQKEAKLLHNRRALQQLSDLLSEGGCCVYVAPSGGRDRPNAEGVVDVSPFDPQSVELFYLFAKQANHPVHFYPLALVSYDLVPPPSSVDHEIGEERLIGHTPIYAAFGDELDLAALGGDAKDKKEQRRQRADAIWQIVRSMYQQLIALP